MSARPHLNALLDLNAILDTTPEPVRSISEPTHQHPPSGPSTEAWKPAPTINGSDTVCDICQDEYNQGPQPEIPLTLPCGHAFGSVCIAQWLHVRNRNHGCPICRNMPFGPPRAGDEDLEDGEIVEDEYDEDDTMSEASDSDETAPGFSRNRAFAEYWNNDAGLILAQMGEELPIAMSGFLGRYQSTELITQMVRTGDTKDMNPAVVALLLSDHGSVFQIPHLSFRLATARQCADLKAAIERAAMWLQGRGTTDYVLRELLAHLEVGWRQSAQMFLGMDENNFARLISAGLLQSRRLTGSFEIRLSLATHMTPMFQEGDHWVKRFVPRVEGAMPCLMAAYRRVLEAQVTGSSTIPGEINFKELWDADMSLETVATPRRTLANGNPAIWSNGNEEPAPRQPAIRTRQPADAARQMPAPRSTGGIGSGSFLTDNNERPSPELPTAELSRTAAVRPAMWSGTASFYRDNRDDSETRPRIPLSFEQQMQRARQAGRALAAHDFRLTLAADDPFRLPSLADLEQQARDQVSAYMTGETRDLPSRNGGQRRNGISGRGAGL